MIVANTIFFPLEHLQWDHVWPFSYVGGWLDRTGHLQMWLSYVWVVTFVVSAVAGLYYIGSKTKKEEDKECSVKLSRDIGD